jgi:hypothetical protein
MANFELTPSKVLLGGIGAVMTGILLALGADIYDAVKGWLIAPSFDLRFIVTIIGLSVVIIGICVILYGVRALNRQQGNQPRVTVQESAEDEIHAYDYPDLSKKLAWETFLPQAEQEIIVVGGSSESLARKTALLKELIQQNKELSITLLIVNPGHDELLKRLEAEKGWAGLQGSARSTLDRVTKLKSELTDDERKRLKLMTYDVEPQFHMVILDPLLASGQIQFGAYISGIDPNHRIVNIFRKKYRKEMFQKYWEEYKTLLAKSREYA